MKRLLLKHISLILLFTFTTTNISSAYGLTGIGASSVILSEAEGRVEGSKDTNLAVQLPSKPVADPSIKSAMRLKSHVAYMTKIDASFLENDGIAHESNGVKILFNEAIQLEMQSASKDKGKQVLRIIPCKIGEETLYLYHYTSGKEENFFDVQTLKQYRQFTKDIVNGSDFNTQDIEKIKEALTLEKTDDISILDPTDERIQVVKGFFESIDAFSLKQRFDELIQILPILSVNGEASTYGSIVIDKNSTSEEQEISILEQFFEMNPDYDMRQDKTVFIDALNVYISSKDKQVKYPETLIRKVKDILFVLNKQKTGFSSNEGGIPFLPSAYNSMIDVSDITLDDCEETITDFRRIFNEVAEHDFKDHKEKTSSTFKLKNMPGYGSNLVIRKISNGVLPTVISKDDGTIIVNENFIKCMRKISLMGLRDHKKGEMFDSSSGITSSKNWATSRGALGNVYFSIIYSTAIHEIRGHFTIDKDKLYYDPDEQKAQSIRGNRFAYANTLAMLFFWFNFVEDSNEKQNIGNFMRENKSLLFSKFDDFLLNTMYNKVDRLLDEFFYEIRGSSRVPIPDAPLPEVPELRGLKEDSNTPPDIMEFFGYIASRKTVFTLNTFSGMLFKDKDKAIKPVVDLFMDWGIIQYAGEQKDEKLYRTAPLTDTEIADIISILSAVKGGSEGEDMALAVESIKEITSKYGKQAEQKNKTAASMPAVSWNDVNSVYSFLTLQRGVPITIAELTDMIFSRKQYPDRKAYRRLTEFCCASLIKLGIVRFNLKEGGYTLSPEIINGGQTVFEGISTLILTIKGAPTDKTIDYSSLAEYAAGLVSGKIETSSVKMPGESTFWKKAADVFKILSSETKPMAFSKCLEAVPGVGGKKLRALLNVLFRTGAVLRYASRDKEPFYSVRRFGEAFDPDMIADVLRSVSTVPDETNLKGLKASILEKYSSARKWKDVMALVPLLISINEVNMVLIKEGMDDSVKYTSGEVFKFRRGMEKKYFGDKTDVTKKELTDILASRYELDPFTAAILDHRLISLEKGGRSVQMWTFNASTVYKYLKGLVGSLNTSTSNEEKELYKIISSLKPEALEVDLFVLYELGILFADGLDYNYSLAKFFDPAKIRKSVSELDEKLLSSTVSSGNYQQIRNVLFANVPPTWPLASFVFESLQAEKDKTVKGEDLLKNFSSGVEKGSWNMFSAVLLYLNKIGIVKDFAVPGKGWLPETGEEFNKTEFSAISLSEEEKEQFDLFIDKIGKVSEQSFRHVFSDRQDRLDLMQALFSSGYINRFKRVTSNLRKVDSYEMLELGPYFEKKKQITSGEREDIYERLKQAYMELTFSSDEENIERMKTKFVLEVMDPSPQGAFYVFKMLRKQLVNSRKKAELEDMADPGYPDFSEIHAGLENMDAQKVINYLEYLQRVGLVEKVEDKYYRPARMYGVQMSSIFDILSGMDERIDLNDDDKIEVTTTKILAATEPLWARRFLDDIKRVESKLSKKEDAGSVNKVLLAFDLSWVPAGQKKYVRDILRAISKMDTIEVLTAENAVDLADKIQNEKGDIDWPNVITFVGKDYLLTETGGPGPFWDKYKEYDRTERSNVFGVDNSYLKDDTYIRLIEMISMSFEYAFKLWDEPLRHPHIETVIRATKDHPLRMRKYILFIPDAEIIDIGHIPEVYRAQVKVLLSA